MEKLKAKILQSEAEKQRVYQYRHQIFTNELNWVASDKEEVDEYDKDSITLAIFKEEQLVASLRLIGHDKKWMFDDDFLHLLPKGIDKKQGMVEASRFFIPEEHRKLQCYEGQEFYFSQLILYVTERYCMQNNLTAIYSVFLLKTVALLQGYCVPITRLDSSETDDWEAVIPCVIHVDPTAKIPRLFPNPDQFLEVDF